jgi:hypothetical protein
MVSDLCVMCREEVSRTRLLIPSDVYIISSEQYIQCIAYESAGLVSSLRKRVYEKYRHNRNFELHDSIHRTCFYICGVFESFTAAVNIIVLYKLLFHTSYNITIFQVKQEE